MALVTAAQVKEAIPQISGTGQDTALGNAISRAEPMLAQFLGWKRNDSGVYALETSTYTEYAERWQVDGRRLFTHIRPLVTVTTVHQSPTETYGSADLVDSSDYALDLERGEIISDLGASFGGWSWGFRHIKLVYTAGFGASGSGPEEVQYAVSCQVQHILRGHRMHGVTQQTIGGQTIIDDAAVKSIDPRAARIMGYWRQHTGLIGGN